MNRERRQWTAQEDELLRMAVNREEPGNPAPSKWHAIAQHVPNRTNKDCRKRWYAKMSSDVVKGGWSPEEDQRLLSAIDTYGTRWSLVASVVQTRNSDQCAKRWCDTLNPAIDRTAWTAEADELLIRAVNEHGKVWTKIVQMYFPGRTGLAAKNRYNSITRSEESSRGSRRRHSPDSSPSPSLELDALDSYYSNPTHSRSQSMAQPGQLPGYSAMSHSSQQQSGHRARHSMSQPSGFAGPSRSHSSAMAQFQPPTNPNYPMSHPSYYTSSSDGSSRYPPSSQYPSTLPGNNSGFNPDYTSLTQNQYSSQPPQQMQYPNPAFNTGYPSSTYPGSGVPRNTSDPRNWGPF
ncbi:hypothetical protein MVEN_02150000 [Mycena venus]|uniref:Uncharacterized protein n=1 Tax=Mycena venus TaxID=2733690 RepID=A0A8H7CIF2_9AGAR|nr:hypothetical protein MVEN_02150000 [Mycena venus]